MKGLDLGFMSTYNYDTQDSLALPGYLVRLRDHIFSQSALECLCVCGSHMWYACVVNVCANACVVCLCGIVSIL